jgi:hypothetical protein
MSLRSRILPGILLFAFSLSFPLGALAQTTGQSYVHIHETPEPQQVTTTTGDVGLSLTTVFSLLDGNDQLLTSFEIQEAKFTIDDDDYTAEVQELETPWTVVVLMDGSKTMGAFSAAQDFKAARTSLANAVTGVPDNTTMALLSFANTAPTVVEFTQKKEDISNAIFTMRASGSGNSCLNNGLYEAVNKLSGAPGRKAVIAFTASADNCATRTPQDVVNLAQKNRVQIYTIGLQGYTVTLDDLTAFSDPTGGLAEFRDQSTLGFGLSNVIGIFKNQWTAKATIYPSAGEKTGTLTINLKDGTSLKSTDFTFTSAQDYIPPAEIHLKGKVQSTADGILFNLDIVQADKIRQLNVTIVSKDTGSSVLSQSLTNFSDVNTLPAVSLSAGLDYTLNVAAVDSSGQVLSQDSADFKYEPPPAGVKITNVEDPSADRNGFQLTVSSTNLSDAVKYKAWLIDTQTKAKIDGTEVTVPLGDPIVIPGDRVGSGTYAAVVQALASDDTVLAESAPFEMVYRRPSIFQQFRTWVSSSPFAIAGLTGVCCLALLGVIGLVWVILPKNREEGIDVDLVMPDRGRKQPAPKPGVQVPPPRPAEPPQAGAPPAPERRAAEPPVEIPVSAAVPNARISLRFPAEPRWSAHMHKSPFRLGRRKDNDGALPVDSSSGVSGYHLTITFERGTYFVLDEKSKFGTSINGQAINKGEPTQLKDGDQIGLGPIVKVVFNILQR